MARRFYAAPPAAVLLTLVACGGGGEVPQNPGKDPEFRLVEVTREVGLAGFRHAGGRPDKAYLPDTVGSGLCAFDHDGDGDEDLYLVNGNDPWLTLEVPPRDALYENRGGTFVDVTDAAGLGSLAWGQGCAVGDVDGDGRPDLYVTNLMEPDLLYRNQGGGRFEEVTREAGLGDDGWGTGAVFFDLEGDGDQDLYVARYVEFDWAPELAGFPCSWRGLAVACGPRGLKPQADLLYCNDGKGRFVECSAERIVPAPAPSYGMTVSVVPPRGGRLPELVVANDAVANFHFENRRGVLVERATETGLAYNADGQAEAGMGLAVGEEEVYVTNFSMETDTLYRRASGTPAWEDVSRAAGLEVTRRNLSWGVAYLDFDADGDRDLFVASGHIYPQVESAQDLELTYAQRDLFLRGDGKGRFRLDQDVLEGLPPRNARGVVAFDLEGDGDLDLVVSNLDAPPTVLRNEGPRPRSGAAETRLPWRGVSYMSNHPVFAPAGGGNAR